MDSKGPRRETEVIDDRHAGSVDLLTLLDWRRKVAELYARVRAVSDPLSAWRLWRRLRGELFGAHPQSPIAHRPDMPPDYFDYHPDWRFAVAIRPLSNERRTTISVGQDGIINLVPFARTSGLGDAFGRELTLYWIEGYGGGCFLPFRDATAGAETYGGGRYLLDTIKSADLGADQAGRLILDFNFSYNPSCAYSERWVCPLPPEANHVPARVRAGERLYPH